MVIAFYGCDHVKTYTIKEGDHYSTYEVSNYSGDNLKFSAIFDESAIYTSEIEENQHDINKLYGFSDCKSHHHQNSARFGWRWYRDRIEIMAYTYVEGERQSKFVGVAQMHKSHNYGIRIVDDKYIFSFDDVAVEMPRGCEDEVKLKYRLFPYFGGDEVAPHDITIFIAENPSKRTKKRINKYLEDKFE